MKCESCRMAKRIKCQSGVEAFICGAYHENGVHGIWLYKGIDREPFCVYNNVKLSDKEETSSKKGLTIDGEPISRWIWVFILLAITVAYCFDLI